MVNADTTAPTNSITLSSVTGGAYLTGTTVYYRGTRRRQPPADQRGRRRRLRAGQQRHRRPRRAPRPAGRTRRRRCPRPAAAPTSRTRSAGPPAPPAAPPRRSPAATSPATPRSPGLTFTNDSTAPTAGTITYADGLAAARSVSISLHHRHRRRLRHRHPPAAAGRRHAVRRRRCGTFGGFANIGADAPTSPYVDGSLGGRLLQVPLRRHRPGRQPGRRDQQQRRQGRLRRRASTPPPVCSSYWRLGEAAPVRSRIEDSFTGACGSALTAHTSASGTTWSHLAGTTTAILTDANRVRRGSADFLPVGVHGRVREHRAVGRRTTRSQADLSSSRT